ncbi:MAG: phosphoribosylformylglycinamidine synthase subunit PurL [Anaerolineaceae bacterium]|nr:phosphoribosylformylglycinamidine synthase subunit PurL [Anaerolineaceae bacterium]
METMPVFHFIVSFPSADDTRSREYLSNAHLLGLRTIEAIECSDLYFVAGNLTDAQLAQMASQLFADPVNQQVSWQRAGGSSSEEKIQGSFRLEVAYHPGVTDPVADQIVRAARELQIPVLHAATGQRFVISGQNLNKDDVHTLARRILANPVIQRYAIGSIEPVFSHPAGASSVVQKIPVQTMNDEELLACSTQRRAALDLMEMQAIRAYFLSEERACTDAEFEMIAQTWSEHCVHKTFKALLDVSLSAPHAYPAQVDNILNTYIRRATEEIAAPWVISAFTDNAGVIAFDDDFEVSFKVETHNHPSAIEPFGGANTGVGGVIRDILGVSAKPIAATDILCFGPQDMPMDDLPEGVLHPRRIYSGVVAGVQDYGNKIGIPTVNGAVWFDPGYTANPLVYCGCIGISPRGLHRRSPLPGDRVIVLGGRTGRDGLRGATFSSMTMDAQTGEVAGASVQIGDPITEKGLIEVIVRARDLGLYNAITDCGAGGLSSAVGEMASKTGADVDLVNVPLKYPGLAPWEIWLSESQERMVIAAPPASLAALRGLCSLFEVEMTDIGRFTENGRLVVRYDRRVIVDLDNSFLHHGIPQRRLSATFPPPPLMPLEAHALPGLPDILLTLLAHPNISSKEDVIRLYDHEVQGGVSVKPLTGVGSGPSDACALKPAGTAGNTGIVLSNGFNPEYGKYNPYRMALCAVDEAVRNAVVVGADPDRLAILDNFCWGDPLQPEHMGLLLEAARGCYDAAIANRTPFISGKDSFNNAYLSRDGKRQSIPPSLLISAIGIIPDICQAVTLDLKQPENLVFLLGDFQPSFGGSHFIHRFGLPQGAKTGVPLPSVNAPALYRAYHRALSKNGLVKAGHDLSEGGLAVAAAEMCIGGGLGLSLDIPPGDDILGHLFGETAGCMLVEVAKDRTEEWFEITAGLPVCRIGKVTVKPELAISQSGKQISSLTLQELEAAWRTPIH